MNREKTNSMTHLTKTIAAEVCKGLMAEMHLFERLENLESRPFQPSIINSEDFIGKIKSSLKKAGEYWTDNEHDLLIQEVNTAIAQIAQNHSRSKGAIKARIWHKDLLK